MRFSIIASALALCLAAASVQARDEETEFERHKAPKAIVDPVFLDTEGKDHHFAEFKGHPTLVNLWATWCAPCIKELPSLDRLKGRLASEELTVITIAVERGGPALAKTFLAARHLTLPAFADPTARLGFALGAPGLPTTLILDRQGAEIARVAGPREWDSPETMAVLKTLLSH